MLFFLIIFALIALNCNCLQSTSTHLIYNTTGSLRLGFLSAECAENPSLEEQSLVHAAIWIVQRFNELKLIPDDELGLSVYRVCGEADYLQAVLELYKGSNQDAPLLGILLDNENQLPRVVSEFATLLHIDVIPTKKFYSEEIVAGVNVLQAFGWMDDIEVFASDVHVLKQFYRTTRRHWMCVNRFHMNENLVLDAESIHHHPLVILGTSTEVIDGLNRIQNDTGSEVILKQILVIPLDKTNISSLPEGAFVLRPQLSDLDQPFSSPKLFEIAAPILFLTRNIKELVKECRSKHNIFANQSECIHSTRKTRSQNGSDFTQFEILQFLKLDHLKEEFRYKVEHLNRTILTYGIFDGNLTIYSHSEILHSNSTCFLRLEHCLLYCENFKLFEVTPVFPLFHGTSTFTLRPEPWVYAFFTLSLLGILISFAILCFILARLCKKQVFEGNPVLSILLLLDVLLMYASVLPFSIQAAKSSSWYDLYLIRALCVTLPYTFAFALFLSRTILLANVNREVGFMSHVSGSVQGFLVLFIFAVQCSLSLQLTNNCERVFHGTSFASLMSYNAVLLVLLSFLTPLIAKSKRNYCEGKYFTIAIIFLAGEWSCWLPAYVVLDEVWKDPLLCVGLMYTATIIIGCIFIPRTYLMTFSAARDRFTNTLPSLATATSAMDIYRASTLHVYDAVNVAAIAAASLREQCAEERRQSPDFYSAPEPDGDLDEDTDDHSDIHTCDMSSNDKVTRF